MQVGGAGDQDAAPVDPIDRATFDAALAPLLPTPRPAALGVACSGGADSLCLALLAAEWSRAAGIGLVAFIVDHGLRPESAAEADGVRQRLLAFGIEGQVLRWGGARGGGNLQARARQARYALIGEAARARGLRHILLGHQLDDQAETFLLRLRRGSGVDGLSAMASVTERDGLALLRPLLAFPRARIEATLRRLGVHDWVIDPSNLDARYDRVRMRALMPALAAAGIDAATLAATAGRMARARQALEQFTTAHLAAAAVLQAAGYAELDLGRQLAAAGEIRLRALSLVLGAVGGDPLPPRLDGLERLSRWLDGRPTRADGAKTLQGCRIVPGRGDSVLICREPALAAERLEVSARSPASLIWDRRFRIEWRPGGRFRGAGLAIARLGDEGWSQLPKPAREAAARRVPQPARAGLPALFDLEGPLAVPHLNYLRGDQDLGLTAIFCPPRWPGAIAGDCRTENRP